MGSSAGSRGGKLDGGAEKQHGQRGGSASGQVPPERAQMGSRVVAAWSPLPCSCTHRLLPHRREGMVLFFKLRRLLGNKPTRS